MIYQICYILIHLVFHSQKAEVKDPISSQYCCFCKYARQWFYQQDAKSWRKI